MYDTKIKSSLSIALICTTSQRIPASASTNQGSEKGDLMRWWDLPGKEGVGLLPDVRNQHREELFEERLLIMQGPGQRVSSYTSILGDI